MSVLVSVFVFIVFGGCKTPLDILLVVPRLLFIFCFSFGWKFPPRRFTDV
ncbi:hypothetical protein Hanom_Chr06g00526431 [Helianthus anomalus]